MYFNMSEGNSTYDVGLVIKILTSHHLTSHKEKTFLYHSNMTPSDKPLRKHII